jgi:hypothetical protein
MVKSVSSWWLQNIPTNITVPLTKRNKIEPITKCVAHILITLITNQQQLFRYILPTHHATFNFTIVFTFVVFNFQSSLRTLESPILHTFIIIINYGKLRTTNRATVSFLCPAQNALRAKNMGTTLKRSSHEGTIIAYWTLKKKDDLISRT